MYNILLIEDDLVDQFAIKRAVEQDPEYSYTMASSLKDAREILCSQQFDAIITDYALGDGTAQEILNSQIDIPLIITTGAGDEEIAVKAMKAGAYDYLVKDSDRNYLKILPITIENAIQYKKAKENEEWLRLVESALLNAYDAVIITETDPEKPVAPKAIYANEAYTKLTGYEDKEVKGKPFPFFKGVQNNTEIAKIKKAIKNEKSITTEIKGLHKNGSIYWAELTLVPVLNGNGRHSHWLYIMHDITSHKLSEELLRQSKERLDIILHSIGDGVVVINDKLEIMRINYKAKELLGVTQTKVLNNKFLDTLKHCRESREDILKILNRRFFANYELHLEKPQNRILYLTGNTFSDIHGKSSGKVIIIRDVTKEKEIAQMKNDFVSNVSHELRTPLASIIGFSSTIRNDKNMPREVQEEFLTIIYEESQRLSQLIEDILNLSRIESGQIKSKREDIDIGAIIKEVFEGYKIQAEKKGLELSYQIEENLPTLYADVNEIKQILINLVGNAIKFTDKGSVFISLVKENDFLILKVQDTGIGIPKGDFDLIFEKFHRVERVGRQIEGTGLGLSIVKEIVNLYNGTIQIESEENKGTCFKIKFPIS